MSRLDDLRALLEDRADAMSGIERDLADVRVRSRRRRRTSVTVGTLASVTVLGAAAVTTLAVSGGNAGQRVTTRRSSSTGPAAPAAETLSSGERITASVTSPAVVFGPYGAGDRWVRPADCPTVVTVRLEATGGGGTSAPIELDPTSPDAAGATVFPETDVGSPTDTTLAVAAVVAHPAAGAHYRLVRDGAVLDDRVASGDLVALFGEVRTGRPVADVATDPQVAGTLHVQRLAAAGTVVSDQVPSEVGSVPSPGHCAPPDAPAALAPGTVEVQAESAAISQVVTSLLPRSAPWTDGLAAVDDPDGTLHRLVADVSTAPNISIGPLDIHQVSPTVAWVRYTVEVDDATTATPTRAFDEWAELRRGTAGWSVTSESFCSLVGSVGLRCPGSPSYAPITGTTPAEG